MPFPLHEEIIGRLDIPAECRELGIEFTTDTPTQKGWLTCWALNRPPGNSPNAAIHVETGVYKDLGATGETLSFFNLAVRYGDFKDWRDARRHYAQKVGLARRLPKKEQNDDSAWADQFVTVRDWEHNPVSMVGFLKRYPQATFEAVKLCGGRVTRYPAKSYEPQHLVTFDIYGYRLADEPPVGSVSMAANGQQVRVYRGDDNPPLLLDKMNRGSSGLVGRYGVRRLAAAEIIYKVEGISDMVALQAFIPPEYRQKHIVVTNACGAGEHEVPTNFAPVFAGRNVVLIHDADRPGEAGIEIWLGALGNGIAASVKQVKLPYPVVEKKGRDLRDWISEGHAYAELLAMVGAADELKAVAQLPGGDAKDNGEATDGTVAGHVGLDGQEVILRKLDIIVWGRNFHTNEVHCYSQSTHAPFDIKDPSMLRYAQAVLVMGEPAKLHLDDSREPDGGKISMKAAQEAIAIVGSRNIITDGSRHGLGIWEIGGRLILVGRGELLAWNGELKRSEVPKIGDKMIEFGHEQWYDHEELRGLLDQSADRKWCEQVVNEACALFERWNNWKYPDTPQLTAAMVCCSWVQTVWQWRPQIAVVGPTNSGKTVLLEDALPHLFGDLALFCQKPTEAGLRQEVRHTAKIIIIDEFEHSKDRQRILELFRTSGRGGTILRGTADQKGMRFGLRHIPWVGAIETGMRKAADRNRYVLLELQEVPQSQGSTLTLPQPPELRYLGIKLLAVTMQHWRAAVALADHLKVKSYPDIDRRIVESYSVPCAMLAAVLGMDQAAAEAMLGGILASRDFSVQRESDEEVLLQEILQSDVWMAKGERATVAQLLATEVQHGSEPPNVALARYGIKRIRAYNGEPERIFFETRVVRKKLLTHDSEHRELEIDQILGRVRGAYATRIRLGGKLLHPGIAIPGAEIARIFHAEGIEELEQKLPGMDEADDADGSGDEIF